jgi:hypothetical protein
MPPRARAATRRKVTRTAKAPANQAARQKAGVTKNTRRASTRYPPAQDRDNGHTNEPEDEHEDEDEDEDEDAEEEEETEQEDSEAMIIDNNDDPFEGVTDPVQRMQIKAMIADEKRKDAEEQRRQELHRLDLDQRQAEIAGRGAAATIAEDDLGESSLSPSERDQVLLFPTVPKKHIIAIARNTFDPGNLPYLENLILDDTTANIISFEDGMIKQSKSIGKASAIKTPAIWSKNFNRYTAIVSVFHGIKHPLITAKLLEFHNDIIELSQTYDWSKAVLVLALLHHRTALHKGFADLNAWTLPTSLIDRYCRAHPKQAAPSGPSSKPASVTNKTGVICRNFNYRLCSGDNCQRDHKCDKCGGDHPAKRCKTRAKKENEA